jgi:hypothetical protein
VLSKTPVVAKSTARVTPRWRRSARSRRLTACSTSPRSSFMPPILPIQHENVPSHWARAHDRPRHSRNRVRGRPPVTDTASTAATPTAEVDPRRCGLGRGGRGLADGGARRVGGEHRASPGPGRPQALRRRPSLGRHRLRPGLRRPAATGRASAAHALRPGGMLLVVDHGSIAPGPGTRTRHPVPHPAEMAAEIDPTRSSGLSSARTCHIARPRGPQGRDRHRHRQRPDPAPQPT